jgi:hypothetical protein
MSETRENEIKKQVMRLVNVVRSTHLKRALTSIDPNPQSHFWNVIYGNLLDIAVLEWCMIFGSDAEPTHWKKVVSVAEQVAFREGLLTAMKIDENEWAKYREQMKSYRDTQVAHYEEETVDCYPNLDHALESSYFYYGFLAKELTRLGVSPFTNDLRKYSEHFARYVKEVAECALTSTAQFRKKLF